MKKLFKTCVALLMVTFMVVSVLAACGGNDNSQNQNNTTNTAQNSSAGEPGKKEPLKFSVTSVSRGGDDENSQVQKEWLKVMEEKMGRPLDITFNRVPDAEYEEKSKLMISTNDLTDFMALPFLYDYAKVAGDGMFLELSQYESILPNYMNWVNNAKDGRALAYLPDGKMYIFMEGTLPRFPADKGMLFNNMSAYNYTVFEKNEIKIPATLDELYAAAKKLKELYPGEYPVNTRFQSIKPVLYAHHTDNDVYWNGQEYVYGLREEGYKESLVYLNKLYTEKLLDPEYLIENNDTIKSKALNQKNFIFMNEWFTSPGEYTRTNTDGLTFAVTMYPDNPKYGKSWQPATNANQMELSNWNMNVVSAKTKEPEELLKFIDLQYSDEIIRLITWGIEGVTYNKGADGKPEFIDTILKSANPWAEGDKYGMRTSTKHRPGLQLGSDATAYVAIAPNDYIYYDGSLKTEPLEKSPYLTGLSYPKNDFTPPWFTGPALTFTTEESQEISKIKTALDTYRDEMQSKFIRGEEKLENWQKFIDGIKKVGDVDRLLQIYNDAAKRATAAK